MKQSDHSASPAHIPGQNMTPESRVTEVRKKYQMLDYKRYSFGGEEPGTKISMMASPFNREAAPHLHSSSDSFQRNYRTQLRKRMKDLDSNDSSLRFDEFHGMTIKDSLSSKMHDSQPRANQY